MDTVLTIPTFAEPFYEQIVDLEGRDYRFEFRYMQRERMWYLTIETLTAETIVRSAGIVCNWPLLAKATHPDRPPGELLAVSAAVGNDWPPKLDELGIGKRVELTYIPAALVAAVRAGT